MKRLTTICKFFAVALLSLAAVMPAEARKKVVEEPQCPQAPKYVFYFIGDGMGVNHPFGAQIYNRATGNGPADINFLQFPVRTMVTTNSATSLVTDSSAGGTALATGVKIKNNAMGVDHVTGQPVSNLCEWAHAQGFGTGVATTVGVNHATPAAFYSHSASRDDYESIAEQLVAAEHVDFAAGGGFNNEKKKTGHDSRYLEGLFTAAGIPVLHGRNEFKDMASINSRVLCLDDNNNSEELKLRIDQTAEDTRLADFVQAGIDYLYGHFAQKGFFFMVEGGLIDHCGHGDDAVADFMEVNDLHNAVDVALAFYNQHPDETLIVITADHETGALMLGSGEYALHPELLAGQKRGEDILNAEFRKLENPSWDEVKDFLKTNLGLWDIVKVSERQEAEFKAMYDAVYGRKEGDTEVVSLYSRSNKIISNSIDYLDKQAGFIMPHGVHTGSPVGLYVKGACAQEFIQCRDNTDIPKLIKKLAGY